MKWLFLIWVVVMKLAAWPVNHLCCIHSFDSPWNFWSFCESLFCLSFYDFEGSLLLWLALWVEVSLDKIFCCCFPVVWRALCWGYFALQDCLWFPNGDPI